MISESCKIPVGLSQALREAGIPEQAVLALAGLSPRLFADHVHHVTAPEYFALWQAIRDVSGNPNVGIQLATLVRPDVTEPLFLAIMSAADVGEALGVVAAFKRLLEPEDLHVVSDHKAKQVEVVYDWPDLDADPPQTLTDAELAFLVHVCRKGTGRRRARTQGDSSQSEVARAWRDARKVLPLSHPDGRAPQRSGVFER
jgi:hypothetical protein